MRLFAECGFFVDCMQQRFSGNRTLPCWLTSERCCRCSCRLRRWLKSSSPRPQTVACGVIRRSGVWAQLQIGHVLRSTEDRFGWSGSTGSSSEQVQFCFGKDLTASKDATPAFNRIYNLAITKAVDKTLVEQIGGTSTLNYSVVATETGLADSAWTVTGTITVNNPNDWQAVSVNVADTINNGGSCSVSPASFTVPASGSVTATYTCTYGSAPTAAAFTNIATATWNATTFATPTGSVSGTAGGAFTTQTTKVNATVTVTDVFNGGSATTLGTLTATDAPAYASATYNYPQTVTVPANNCSPLYPNTATIIHP